MLASPEPPKGLKAWGQLLWDRVIEGTKFDAAGYFILAEACRTADIVEKLSGALSSRSTIWIGLAEEAQIHADAETVEINIVVNPLLGEIRQQRATMRALLAQLKLGNAEVATDGDTLIDKMIKDFAGPDK